MTRLIFLLITCVSFTAHAAVTVNSGATNSGYSAGSDAVGDLDNNTYFVARNAADDGDVDLLKADASDNIEIENVTSSSGFRVDITGALSGQHVKVVAGGGNYEGYMEVNADSTYYTGQVGVSPHKMVMFDLDNDHSVTLRSADAVTADYVLVLPPDDGGNGQVLSTNGSGTTSWIDRDAPSDISIKDVKGSYLGGLDAIEKIDPITFKYKPNDFLDSREHVGFSAQNVEAAIPLAVYESRGIKHLEDRAVIAVLVNAVKELSAEVERLKAGR